MTTEDLLVMKDKVKALLEEAKQLNLLIKSTCHHPLEKIEPKTYYFNGSYNDMAYTEYWNECSICQERSVVTRKDHNYYG
jgi:hypothetical protein